MRKIYLSVLLVCCVVLNGYAQENQDEIQFLQSLYGMDKREIVEEFLELDTDEQAEFWRLYEEYEVKRKELGAQSFQLMQKYVDEYGKVDPDNADNFMKQAIQLRIKNDNLRDAYFKKIKNATDPVVAMQFYQIERYLSDLVRIELLEEIYTTKNNK